MSAIAGFVGKQRPLVQGSIISKMLASMSSEPGATLNTRFIPDAGLELGWLSTPESDKECTFVLDKENTVFLLLRGELFSDEEVGALDGGSRAEKVAARLLSQISPFNPKAISNLNGWFSGVLVDRRANTVTLFNDRYGLGRIYYHQTVDKFFFASEAKALLRVLPAARELDVQGLGEFLSCDCILQDRTLFRDVFILPAGSTWTLKPNGVMEKRRYFQPNTWENQPRLSPQRYYDSLKELFPKVLERYMCSAGDIGMSLTGGLDGRLVMAWSKAKAGQMPCYSFGSSYRETADVRIAREVASVCEQPYSEFKVDGEFLSNFPHLAQQAVHISDGAMDVSGAAELYVNRLARQIKPVRLTGNYGSEILRGNIAFRARPFVNNILDAEVADALEQACATYAEESRGDRRSFIAFKQMPWYHFGRASLEKSQLIVRSPYLDNELVKLSFQAPNDDRMNFDLNLKLVADGNSKLARIPTDRGIQYGTNTLLNRLRRSSKQFLAKAEYAYDYGMPSWLARADRLFSPLKLERAFLGRQKFYHFRTWYRRQLADFVREVLLDRRTLGRPWLNARRVEDIVASHIKGYANHTLLIHKLLSLELIHRTLLEQHR
jgi:asparagine synthase (glutamine-hydrolysing)